MVLNITPDGLNLTHLLPSFLPSLGTNNNGQSGGFFYPVNEEHEDYTVDDYGAYYELSPRHNNTAPTSGSSGDVQGHGGKLPLSAGDIPGPGLAHSTSYSLYGYGINDEYGEIYAGLSVEQREEEALRDAGRSRSVPSRGFHSLRLPSVVYIPPVYPHLTCITLHSFLSFYSIRTREGKGSTQDPQSGT